MQSKTMHEPFVRVVKRGEMPMKKKGVAIIYVGEDLDVLLELCDRILVLCGGKVSGIVDGRTITKEEVGFLMTTHKGEGRGHD